MTKLSSLVRKYSIIQADSLVLELAYSTANFFQRKKRSSLSPDDLQYSIFQKEMPKMGKLKFQN
jgi:hypothetical protein